MSTELTEVEKKLILLMRQLKPHEYIQIKVEGDKVLVTVTSTVREQFPYSPV